MKQTIFETKQRANELMRQALGIWKDSDQSEHLETLEKDPVFNVIMSALAYQANDFDDEVAQLKSDIIAEFAETLSAGNAGGAVPATMVIKTNAKGLEPVIIDETTVFTNADRTLSFLPFLRSTVYNILEARVDRIDGRRWRVRLTFPEKVKSPDGMTFAISNLPYHGLKVTQLVGKGEETPLDIISLEDTANLPVTDYFSLQTLLYNRQNAVSGGDTTGVLSQYYRDSAHDICARQGVNVYCISLPSGKAGVGQSPQNYIDLCFEFMGIGEDFSFNASRIDFNVIILANMKKHTVTLSAASPIVKLSDDGKEDFVCLLQPNKDQMLKSAATCVRHINADRFNRSNLIQLTANLIGRFQTDYYAFIDADNGEMEYLVNTIISAMTKIHDKAEQSSKVTRGVYLMFDSTVKLAELKGMSLNMDYLTTEGAAINNLLTKSTKVFVPGLLDEKACSQIIPPVQGLNAVRTEKAMMARRKYQLATNDRLVTPADLKLFCYNELNVRYGIVRDMVAGITVGHERVDMGLYHSYCVKVDITLVSNNFVRRAFNGKVEEVEHYLEKMMQVRSANIYPIKVKMII